MRNIIRNYFGNFWSLGGFGPTDLVILLSKFKSEMFEIENLALWVVCIQIGALVPIYFYRMKPNIGNYALE